MINRFFKIFIILSLFQFSTTAFAEGWCNYAVGGFEVITNGNKTDNVYLVGKFEGATVGKWVTIANSTAGKHNISLALAAQMAGKGLAIYIDSAEYNCDTYPSWSNSPLRHVRIRM
ncbi:hypothetical protein [Aliikangiella maris]|uniref:Uncharacterized protein n=2 Tax=Aliikangiella maris TaxID=3162458 RepID=A0ABV2C0C2_9GAMM